LKNAAVSSKTSAGLLIAAQLLALAVLGLALNFVLRTTGGTLFLFASVAPLLMLIGILFLIGVGVHKYNLSHHLFDVETYVPGAVIVRQGEPGACAYFIQDGEVEVIRNEQGQDRVIATLGKDEYFGEMALISDSPRNATVRAVKETRVAALGKDNFVKLLSVLPATKESILQTVQARAKQVAATKD
jgi:hypothetical protein